MGVSRKNIILSIALAGILIVGTVHPMGVFNDLFGEDENYVSEEKYNELREKYEKLQEEKQERGKNIERADVNQTSSQLYTPYVAVKNRTYILSAHYLNGETAYYQADTESLESQIMHGHYMRELSKSEMEELGMTDLASRFDGETKYHELGDFGTYYEYDPFVREENFKKISEDIYHRYNNDRKRIKEVWNFVTQINTYNNSTEINEETPRLPLETLLMRGGDCEDTVILAASMLKAMPEDWEIKIVYMDEENPTNPQDIDHVVVYVDTGDYSTIVETTSAKDMNPFEKVDGFYSEVD